MSKLDTKFADMPDGVRAAWLNWARSHDWGGDRKPRYVHHRLLGAVLETTCDAGGDAMEVAFHKTPRDLRNWAGY